MIMYNLYLSTSAAVATILVIITTSILIRLVHVIRCIRNNRRRDINDILQMTSDSNEDDNNNASNINNMKQQQVKTMIILGSGGHTTEMIRLLQELDPLLYTPVVYIVAESDTTSIERLQKYIKENEVDNEQNKKRSSSRWIGRYPIEKSSNQSSSIDSSKQSSAVASVYRLPRAREVHQSYYTSIFTTIHSFLQTRILLNKIQPELLLTNGPGTCIPVIYSLFLHQILSFKSSKRSCKIMFVESLCRVQTLSLSGKLVYPIVDRFIVHWPYLKEKYPLVDVCDVFVRHDTNTVASSKDE